MTTTVTVTGGTTRVTVGGATKRITLSRNTVAAIANNRPTTSITSRNSAVTVSSAAPSVTVGSAMGVQGPAGQDGADGGSTIARVASGALGGHRVVRSVSANGVAYADATNADHGDDTVGMTVAAASDGAAVEIQRAGSLTMSGWSWTPGLPVFLGANGLLTQTVPDDTNAFIQIIGHAEAADTVFIQIEPPTYY